MQSNQLRFLAITFLVPVCYSVFAPFVEIRAPLSGSGSLQQNTFEYLGHQLSADLYTVNSSTRLKPSSTPFLHAWTTLSDYEPTDGDLSIYRSLCEPLWANGVYSRLQLVGTHSFSMLL